MKEYNLQLKVRNNLLLERMREQGIETAADLSRASGVSQSRIGEFLNLKVSALMKKKNPVYGEDSWVPKKDVVRLCEFFGCDYTDLFPEYHLYTASEKNTFEAELTKAQLEGVCQKDPELLLEHMELPDVVANITGMLSHRERKVINLRFGLGDNESHTLTEVGDILGVTGEHVRRIQEKAMRKLRHPTRTNEIKKAFGQDGKYFDVNQALEGL